MHPYLFRDISELDIYRYIDFCFDSRFSNSEKAKNHTRSQLKNISTLLNSILRSVQVSLCVLDIYV